MGAVKWSMSDCPWSLFQDFPFIFLKEILLVNLFKYTETLSHYNFVVLPCFAPQGLESQFSFSWTRTILSRPHQNPGAASHWAKSSEPLAWELLVPSRSSAEQLISPRLATATNVAWSSDCLKGERLRCFLESAGKANWLVLTTSSSSVYHET